MLDQAFEAHGKSLAHSKGELIPITADITDKASIQALVEEIGRREKHVDVSKVSSVERLSKDR